MFIKIVLIFTLYLNIKVYAIKKEFNNSSEATTITTPLPTQNSVSPLTPNNESPHTDIIGKEEICDFCACTLLQNSETSSKQALLQVSSVKTRFIRRDLRLKHDHLDPNDDVPVSQSNNNMLYDTGSYLYNGASNLASSTLNVVHQNKDSIKAYSNLGSLGLSVAAFCVGGPTGLVAVELTKCAVSGLSKTVDIVDACHQLTSEDGSRDVEVVERAELLLRQSMQEMKEGRNEIAFASLMTSLEYIIDVVKKLAVSSMKSAKSRSAGIVASGLEKATNVAATVSEIGIGIKAVKSTAEAIGNSVPDGLSFSTDATNREYAESYT